MLGNAQFTHQYLSNIDMYVAVTFELGAERTFTYSVPERFRARVGPGHRVLVPFMRGERYGFVVGDADPPEGFAAKDIIDVPDESPLVPATLMELAGWMSSYYHSPLGMVLGMMLPPGVGAGKVSKPRRDVREDTEGLTDYSKKSEITPTSAQEKAISTVIGPMAKGVFSPFVLHGATGSGKTEVYIRSITGLPEGSGAIVLVPEISLTPQLVGRFRERFGDRIAVMHSGLTESQRRAEWRRVREGEASVCIGARSAVFAPFDKVGLIVVDEEHDGSYKQEEGVRYNGRDVAVMRAKLQGCPVMLGSATPSLESYHNAMEGRYSLLELPERVTGHGQPRVRIIDIRERKEKDLIQPELVEKTRECLKAGRQAIFFINRRGFSDFLICRDCGHVPGCTNCSISLTFHQCAKKLSCHWCGTDSEPPGLCPECGGDKLKLIGGGTEKVEEELAALFPDVKLTRMDRDTITKRGAFRELLEEVASGRSGILVGTQLVAKGHDIPNIGLVGVVLADYGLHGADFRAAERVFQVVMQVAGRAGRGDHPGEVIVQTYSPEHYSLIFASKHDYKGFYDIEAEAREELSYPPFSRLALVSVKGVKDDKAKRGAEAAKTALTRAAKGTNVIILGPAPAPIRRVRGKYRYNILLKSKDVRPLHAVIDKAVKGLAESKALSGCRLDVDIDPQGMV
jgi:primosomal protein N' (replication factor Y)